MRWRVFVAVAALGLATASCNSSCQIPSSQFLKSRVREEDFVKVKPGLSAEDVVKLWGRPDQEYTRATEEGRIYLYHGGVFVVKYIYVYFRRDGTVREVRVIRR